VAARIAIVYGTTEGQTAKIAQHLAARGRARGHEVEVRNVAELPRAFDLGRYDGVVIGASIHLGRHQRRLLRWVREHRSELARRPAAWFTVCLGIRSRHAGDRAMARSFPEQMTKSTGFEPGATAVFAGACKYTAYNWLVRLVLREISRREGGSTDTSRDHEYTDWAEVDAFGDAFFARFEATSTHPPAPTAALGSLAPS
jgi:menaquinone-dependent protoporphyrinogen oxidase